MLKLLARRAAKAAAPREWPPEFDAQIYLNHPWNAGDLSGLAAAEAATHYEAHGRREGRICAAVSNRAQLTALVPRRAKILEIGPFCFPTFDKATHDVRFVDVFTTEQLRARTPEGGDPDRVPQIDYLWTGQPLSELIGERFDVVFSSHAIEHQTCLVSHLQDLERLLKPGGAVFLVAPDKRYCFDHFLAETTLVEVLAAWFQPGSRHKAADVIEQAFFTTHNDVRRHWAGDHGEDPFARRRDRQFGRDVQGMKAHFNTSPDYIDVHAWQFTPESFRRLAGELHAMDLSPLAPSRVYPTVYGTAEFFAILERGAAE